MLKNMAKLMSENIHFIFCRKCMQKKLAIIVGKYIHLNTFYGRDDVGKYTFYILEKMYADPPVIEHFGTKTKQGRETLFFNV